MNEDLNKFANPIEIILGDDGKLDDKEIELIPAITGNHGWYGKVKVTKDDLKSLISNFKKKAIGTDIMIDFNHERKEAAGWVKEVRLGKNEKIVLGTVKWTPEGRKSLEEKRFRYFSPEFTDNYVDAFTEKEYGFSLLGGALTNRPFYKRMKPIVKMNSTGDSVMSENNEVKVEMITAEKHEEAVEILEKRLEGVNSQYEKKLSESIAFSKKNKDLELKILEFKDKIKAMEAERFDMNEKLSLVERKNIVLNEKLASLQRERDELEMQEKNLKLFNEDKITKAQLDALNEGCSAYDVLSLSGIGEKATTLGKTASNVAKFTENERYYADKFNLTKEEFLKHGNA